MNPSEVTYLVTSLSDITGEQIVQLCIIVSCDYVPNNYSIKYRIWNILSQQSGDSNSHHFHCFFVLMILKNLFIINVLYSKEVKVRYESTSKVKL